jgi:hypothetical protein
VGQVCDLPHGAAYPSSVSGIRSFMQGVSVMFRCAIVILLTAAAFTPAADKPAAPEKTNKPAGTWTHTVNEFTVTFKFEAHNKLAIQVAKNDAESVSVETAYGVTDDGVLFGYTTNVEKKGTEEGPEKGDLYSFAYKIDRETLTVSDLNGSKPPNDAARQLIQGEYKRMNK